MSTLCRLSTVALRALQARLLVALVCAGICVLAGNIAQAQDEPEARERNYQQRINMPFITKNTWNFKLADAVRVSKEKNMPVFAYFTRSWNP